MGLGVAVAFAGGLGTLARYGVQAYVVGQGGWPTPAGTFPVNVLGSLLHDWQRLVLGAAFLGGFTTFSTLAFELHGLVQGRAYPLAFAYAAGTILAGLAAVYAGMLIARA
jgi:CrcB protein